MKVFKKLLISIILSVFLLTSFSAPVAHAQATWFRQEYKDWYTKVYPDPLNNPDEIFGERYTAAQVEWVIYGLIAFINHHAIGTDNAALIDCLMATPPPDLSCVDEAVGAFVVDSGDNPQPYAYSEGVNNPLATFFAERPLSGIGYLREKASKLKLVPEAKAQGFGFLTAAEPIQKLWVASRNMTYFFLVLATIAMAFMIMFRVKLSPQTVITLQSAIPKIIITLILITFSYAIAGFMIDLMYVAIGLIATLFSQSDLFRADWVQLFNSLSGQTDTVFTLLFRYLVFSIIVVLGFLASSIFEFIIGIIILVISIIMIIFLLFKVAFMLLKTFFFLLLQIALAPFIILGGLLGGGGFSGWLKNIIADLAVFATVGPMFAFSFLFLANAINKDFLLGILAGNSSAMPFFPNEDILRGTGWAPPFTTGGGPLGLSLGFFWYIASLVILTLIPKIPDVIKGAVSGRPFAVGTGIGEALGPAAGVGWAAGGVVSGGELARYRAITGTPSPRQRIIHTGLDILASASGGRIRRS